MPPSAYSFPELAPGQNLPLTEAFEFVVLAKSSPLNPKKTIPNLWGINYSGLTRKSNAFKGHVGGVTMKSGQLWGIVLVVILAAAVFAAVWFLRGESGSRQVNLAESVKGDGGPSQGAVLRVAVAAMISPMETEKSYFELLRLVGKRLGRKVELVQRKTYAEINDLLERREIDLALVCSGPYVAGHKKFGMELLAVPVVHGGTVYYSYFIVRRDGPIKNLQELRGRRFAFADPDSNTGYIVPRYVLSQLGETPEHFFGETFFTHSHDNSIKAVADGLADGAAVDSLIFEYMNAVNPADTGRTRIIYRSPPYGIPPVVIHPALDPGLKLRLRELFLHLHEDPEAQPFLTNIQIDRFVAGDDAMYASVREMEETLKAQK